MITSVLFEAGRGEDAVYRIPALLSLPSGRLIAFCEGRRDGVGDSGTIRILQRISDDNGRTFGPVRAVVSMGEDTVNNPAPVYDRDTGVLWLLCNGNPRAGGESNILRGHGARTVLCVSSADDGEHWSAPRDLTRALKPAAWTWYAMGPCHAVQLRSGRLLVPCNHAVLGGGHNEYRSHVVYSDDHGQSWRVGGEAGLFTNECALAELPDGRVYLNMRSYHGGGCRAVAYSTDGGETFRETRLDAALPDPVCQGSVLYDARAGLLFVNAADARERRRLTLRRSADGGEHWSEGIVVAPGPAAYADLAALADGSVACLYECGERDAYASIALSILSPEEIAGDAVP